LWHLTARLVDRGTASRAVALFAFAPGAFVLSMTYSEPLFLLLACSCLLFLNARRWELAGVCALLACLTRPNGLAVVAACATAAVVAVWQAREWRALVAPALAAVGFVALPIYDRIHTGDALAYWRTQRDGWHQGFDFGANTVRELGRFLSHPTGDVNRTMSALAIMVIAGGLVLMARWRPPLELWAYTIVILGMALTTRTLTSSFRFTMTAFPLTIAYARVLRREAFTAAVAVSAVLFAIAAAAAAALIYTP
jgi:hypothetical protein